MGHVVLVVAANVDQPHAPPGRRLGELGVLAQEIVQAGNHVQLPRDGLQNDRPPRGRNLAAGRGDAEQQRVGADRLGQRADHRQRAAHAQQFLSRLPRRSPIQHGHDFLRLVTDQANRRLGDVGVVEAVGEHDHSPRGHGSTIIVGL